MKQLAAFVRLSRFKFLIGGFLGGALGTAIAYFERGHVSLGTYALAQFALTSAHYMTQLCNEYYDLESDARTERTPYSGGSGALVDGSLAPEVALYGSLAAMLASAAGTIALFASGHILAAILALLIIPLAWSYSAPPLRLVARGLGELDAVLVVAVLLPLCAYAAQTQALDARAVATVLPGAAAMFALMIGVQFPDAPADAATGKRNLIVRLGTARAARLGMASLIAIVLAVPLAKAFGAPLQFCVFAVAALVPIALLAREWFAAARRRPYSPRAIAMLGSGVFSFVSALGMLAYVVAARP